ncbi:ATP-dependent helicase [Ureaplasma ceti]|uniref:DNA 3'-5' helicase n=1 Tax=Ureaplasma ceti TaxID=3119530 RepID=A0ABP9U6W4_9BACT
MNLDRLNETQRQAVTYPVEPLMVMAGAGTGKTTVLTNRVAYLVNHYNIDPRRVLAITFTNKAANEMNERIAKIIGYPIEWIGTFHAICIRILRREIYHLNRNNNFKVVDDEEQTTILKDIYEQYGYKNADISYKNMLHIIDQIKTNMYDIEDIRKPEILLKWNLMSFQAPMVINVYQQYLNKFEAYNYLDFNDILIYTDAILTHFADAREYWSNRFSYILVDEFQDTNDIQYRLIKFLGGERFNVFAVGDEDQTIYTFRGANPRIIHDFIHHDHKEIPVIKLEENYRSTQQILDVANELIGHNVERIRKNLFSSKVNGSKPNLYVAENDDEEANWVARKISELTDEYHVALKDIAVLYRSNYVSRPFEQALISEGIRYTLYGGFKFYQRTEIKDIIAYLTAIQNNDELSLRRIINVPRRKISDTTVKTVMDYAGVNNLSFWDALNQAEHITGLSNIQQKSIANFVDLMYSFKQTEYTSIGALFDDVVNKTQYTDYVSNKDSQKEKTVLDNLQELKNGMLVYQEKNKAAWSLEHYLQEIALFTSADDKKKHENSVSLMTVHAAKGLEFEYVFLVNFVDGSFPSVHSVESRHGIEEERRLAYVAITRAKKHLYISANTSYMFQKKMNKVESRFLHEVKYDSLNRLNKKIVKKSSWDLEWYDSQAKPKLKKEDVYEVKSVNDYKIGDQVVHTVFGLGTVIGINNDILTIGFKPPYNVKEIIYNHKAIKRQIM